MKENHFVNPSKKRHTPLYLLLILCVFITAILALPSVLSTNFGQAYLTKRLSSFLKGSVQIQDLQLSWFKSQSIIGFDYQSLDKNHSLQFEKILIEDSLYSLLTHQQAQKLTQVISPTLHTNLSKKNETSPLKLLALFMNHLFIQNGSINLLDNTYNALSFQNLDVRLELDSASHLSIKGNTVFNQTKGTINLYTDLNDDYLLTRLFSKDPKTPKAFDYKGSIQLNDVPTFMVAELLSQANISQDLVNNVLGSTFNLNTDFKFSDQTLDLDVNISSQYLQMSLSAATQNQMLVLQKPASIALTISPTTFKTFFKQSEFTFTENSIWKINLNQFSIPYIESSLDISHLAYQLSINGAPGYIFHKDTSAILIQNLSLYSSTTNVSDKVNFSLKSTLQDALKTASHANISFTAYPTAFLSQNNQAVIDDIKMDILKFPLYLVDNLLNTNTSQILGNTLTLNTTSVQSQPNLYAVTLSTPKCSIPNALFLIDHSIRAKQPFLFSCDSKFLTSIQTAYKNPLSGTVETLQLSLAKNLEKESDRFNCKLKLDSGTLAVRSAVISNELSFKNTTVFINAKTLRNPIIEASTTISYIDKSTLIDLALSQPIAVHFTASLHLEDEKSVEIPHFECLLQSDTLYVLMQGALTDDLNTLSFSKPISLRFLPSLEFIDCLTHNDPYTSYNVYVPTKATLTLQPLQLNKNIFQYLACQGEFVLDKVKIINNHSHQEYSLLDIKGNLSADATKKTFSCALQSNVEFASNNSQEGSLTIQATSESFNCFDFFKKNLTTKVSCKHIPSDLLDAILKSNPLMTSLLGDKFNSDIELAQGDACTIKCELKSPNLSLKTDFKIIDKTLYGTKNSLEADWLITPQAYAALQNFSNPSSQGFELAEKTSLHVKLDNLLMTLSNDTLAKKYQNLQQLLPSLNNELNTATFDLKAKLDPLKLRFSQKNQVTSLDYITVQGFKSKDQNTAIFNIEAKAIDPSKEVGEFVSIITLQPSKVVLTKPLLTSKCHASLKQFPTEILDGVCRLFGLNQALPSTILGKKVNATFASSLENLSGTLDLEVDSTNSKATMNAYLNDGVLKLASPAQATTVITKNLADLFLNKMNVRLATAKKPLTLVIDNQGFYLPLFPFEMSQVRLRKATLDFGELLCENLGSAQDIGGFFKLQLANPVSLWFAPLELGINQGVMSVDRTELLYDRAYQICFWGKINLIKQKVKMILGLTEQSLRKALGIQGLPRNFVLQIPMEGSFNNVKINKEIGAARIAFLLAKSSGLTKQGGVFGNVVDLFGDMANDQRSTPPAKPPFPWQQALSQHEEEERQKTTVNILK